jgi:hypothetical protein
VVKPFEMFLIGSFMKWKNFFDENKNLKNDRQPKKSERKE